VGRSQAVRDVLVRIVKIAPTPMPAAGPTVAAAQEFCGDATGKAEELIERYSTKPGLKQVFKSADYVAFSDDEKNSSVMYTFTALTPLADWTARPRPLRGTSPGCRCQGGRRA
jgi:hypothetical protein